MKKIITISTIIMLLFGCRTLFCKNKINDINKHFTTANGVFMLVIKNGHIENIAAGEILVQADFLIYQITKDKKVLKIRKKMNLDDILILKNNHIESNSIFLEDLNGDKIPEIICKTIWPSGSYPPFFILGLDSLMTKMVSVSCSYQIRYPVFYKNENLLSISNGQIGMNDTTIFCQYNPINFSLEPINNGVTVNDNGIIFSENK